MVNQFLLFIFQEDGSTENKIGQQFVPPYKWRKNTDDISMRMNTLEKVRKIRYFAKLMRER